MNLSKEGGNQRTLYSHISNFTCILKVPQVEKKLIFLAPHLSWRKLAQVNVRFTTVSYLHHTLYSRVSQTYLLGQVEPETGLHP